MHTETMDRQAFELVARAMERLDDYNRDHQLSFLQDAESDLTKAVTRDAQYVDASFYAGIVKDLIGKAADAVPFFDKILNNLPKESENQRDLVQYSRGVAWYHQYSHNKLEQAEKDFLIVVNRSKDAELRLLARAGLAQTYAMWMIPRTAGKDKLRRGEGAEELNFIAEKRNQCLKQVAVSNEEMVRFGFKQPQQPATLLSGPINGTVLNAQGMCNMYWTDYNVKDTGEKRSALQEAIGYLQMADKYLPGDWANTCDIGSAHFRLGAVERESGGDAGTEFQKALDFFQMVISDLRPDYGFALYEMGRIYRVWGRFDEAKKHFERAQKVPEQYRDVRDSNVKYEFDRAEVRDSSFP
jgi:tetratricopeptide (TPR) repeat protein